MPHHPTSATHAHPVDPAVARFLAPVGGDPDDDNWPSADPPSEMPQTVAEPPPAPDGHVLSPRQEAFADAYAREPNGAAAARAAGYAAGSAKVAAARNLRRSGVLMRIMTRRREQALAREAQRTRIAGILDEALALARERQNPHALARIAGLMMRLEGLHTVSSADDRLLADATEEQMQELLACYEIAAGTADPELPDPEAASVEELADRAAALMQAARDKARPLPGVRVADGYLSGLLEHLDRGVRDAAEACAFARLAEEGAIEERPGAAGPPLPDGPPLPLGERGAQRTRLPEDNRR